MEFLSTTRVFFLLLIFSIGERGAPAAVTKNPIPDFEKVERGIYRGGAPGAEGLVFLKKLGIRTILNLDDRKIANAIELEASKLAGIREFPQPMSGFWEPKDASVNAALATLGRADLRPIFIHCEHGQDRTGLVVGLYRVFFEHWQPAHAYREMRQLGFHPELIFLNHYFEIRTGWDD
jgi:protein tyrosine/serine phosphatase